MVLGFDAEGGINRLAELDGIVSDHTSCTHKKIPRKLAFGVDVYHVV